MLRHSHLCVFQTHSDRHGYSDATSEHTLCIAHVRVFHKHIELSTLYSFIFAVSLHNMLLLDLKLDISGF